MALIEINWRPDRKQLRGFGWISLVAFGAIGTWIFFKHSFLSIPIAPIAAERTAYVLWASAGICALLGLTAPLALRPLFVGLTLVSLPIGFVVSHVIMFVVFYVVLTPVGLVFRLVGYDPLNRKLEPEARSYWVQRKLDQDTKRYFRQF